MLTSTALQLGPSRGILVNTAAATTATNRAAHKHLLHHGSCRSLPLLTSSGVTTSSSSGGGGGGGGSRRRSSRGKTSFNTAVAAVDSSAPAEKQGSESKTYHFVVANAKFMLDEEEHFQEQLFERLRSFGERNIKQDFWLVIEPKFLEKFPDITKRLKRPAVALVSTNGPWITFMKLRLDRVLRESFDTDSLEEALASNPVELKFEKPEKWVAPYPKYEFGWWEKFLPPGSKTANV